MADRISIADARNHFAKIVRRVERGGPIEVTRRGKPVAVIVSAEEYARLASGRQAFWDTCVSFREERGVAELGIDGDVFRGVRDREVGRSVDL